MFNSILAMYNIDPSFQYYVWFFVIIIGLVIGSFLNVVALRFLSNESIVFPPSKCPKCNTKLKWYDNIPILAYILLLGKCRYCKKPISVQYPIVEAVTSIMFLLVFLQQGFSLSTLMLWILFSCGIVMCVTDFREQVIFDAISIPLIPIGLIYSFFNLGNFVSDKIQVFNFGFSLQQTFIDSIIGTISAFLLFEIISLFSKLLFKQRAFGEGDTVIAMAFGAWFGWKIMLLTSLLAVLVQSICTLPIMIIKLIKSKDKIAITSFLILILSAIIPFALKLLPLTYQAIVFPITILLLILAIICALIFLRRIRESNSFTLLPFGPAIIIAGFIAAMYLTEWISNLF